MTASAIGSPVIVSSPSVRWTLSPVIAPTLVGAAAALAAHRWSIFPQLATYSDTVTFASAVASVGGTMLGFMLAALAVLASINHTHLVTMMRRTGHYINLLATLSSER